jgi:signal transduction histidine kinase
MKAGLPLKWRLAMIVGITIVLSHVSTFAWFMAERAATLERFARSQTEGFAEEVVGLYSRPGQAQAIAPSDEIGEGPMIGMPPRGAVPSGPARGTPPRPGGGRDVLIVIAAPPPVGAPPGEASSYRPIEVVRPLPEGGSVRLVTNLERQSPWRYVGFVAPTILISLGAVVMSFIGMTYALRPLERLTAAADRLGVAFDAPPVPEDRGAPELRQASQAFNRMRERLRGFIRERTQMLAAIGHDLRTPLTKLRLRMEFVDDAEIRQSALADIDSMERLIGEFTAFAREAQAPSPPEAIPLSHLVEEVRDDLRADEDRIWIDVPDDAVAFARAVPLRRAVTNVLANALAYGDRARVSAVTNEEWITLTVDDDGPGIPPEDRERVFEPFVRLDASRNREHGGTGLGLAITRDAVRAVGGSVSLSDASSGGLRVTLRLPRARGGTEV